MQYKLYCITVKNISKMIEAIGFLPDSRNQSRTRQHQNQSKGIPESQTRDTKFTNGLAHSRAHM